MNANEKVALITGANKGLGLEMHVNSLKGLHGAARCPRSNSWNGGD